MNVGDFLQLQRAFHGDRVVDAAAQEQRVVALRELLRPHLDLRFDVQHALQRHRQVAQGMQQFLFTLARQAAAHLGQHHGQQRQRRQLRGEGLGRGDADLRTGAGEEAQFGRAHQR